MDSKATRVSRRISEANRFLHRLGFRPPVLVFAILLLTLTAYGAVVRVTAGVAATPPDCPAGTVPFFGDFPTNNQGSIVSISACVPAGSAPTPRSVAPGSGDAIFVTPTPALGVPTTVPTQAPLVVTVVATPTASAGEGTPQPVLAPIGVIRAPNTGTGGLLP